MPLLPLTPPGFSAEVDEVDLLPALLYGSWCLNNSGYPTATSERVTIALHVFVAKRMGLVITETVDHKNRNKLDCRRENLVPASQSEQIVNQPLHVDNTSGHKCICWHAQREKWHVQVKRNGKKVHVALCKTLEEAIRRRDKYIQLHKLRLDLQ